MNKNNKTAVFSFTHFVALLALTVLAVGPAVLSAHEVSNIDARMQQSDSMYVNGMLMIRLPTDMLPASN